VNNNYCGRVVHIDDTCIWLETNPTNSFAIGTYVLQTVYILKDYRISSSKLHAYGVSKVGGSSVPPDILVTIDYTNNTGTTKYFVGDAEILY
jgi:hypothetical protein